MRWLRGLIWWRQIDLPKRLFLASAWDSECQQNFNFSDSLILFFPFYWYYALVFISGLYTFKELVNIGGSDDWGFVFMVYLVMSIGYIMKTCTLLGEKWQRIQFISLFILFCFLIFLFVISHQLRIMCSLERKRTLSFCFRFTSDLVVDLKLCSLHALVSASLYLRKAFTSLVQIWNTFLTLEGAKKTQGLLN